MSDAFTEWLAAVLGHDVSKPEWYWAPEFDEYWEAHAVSDELTVEYMTRLLSEHRCLAPYSLAQVAQGIWFLIGEASPAQPSQLLVDSGVSLEQRLQCIAAMGDFFRAFVAPAAPGPSNDDSDPFHMACYMWWDIFPYRGGPEVREPRLSAACLDVMRGTLALPSELCQISALHGLNHWQPYHASEVERTVAAFLGSGATLSSRVRQYAQTASFGMAL